MGKSRRVGDVETNCQKEIEESTSFKVQLERGTGRVVWWSEGLVGASPSESTISRLLEGVGEKRDYL